MCRRLGRWIGLGYLLVGRTLDLLCHRFVFGWLLPCARRLDVLHLQVLCVDGDGFGSSLLLLLRKVRPLVFSQPVVDHEIGSLAFASFLS